jgi:protein involved in polysaccharide export with SLBB domain
MKRAWLIVPLFLLAQGVIGQENELQSLIRQDRPSRYYIGKEDELLMPVNVLGFVAKPGQYLVPSNTDLISLVAYAGGFVEGAKLSRVKIVRSYTQGKDPAVVWVNLAEYFNTADRHLLPPLRPDDTVIISGSKGYTFRRVLDFVARLTVLAQIYFYITVARRQ